MKSSLPYLLFALLLSGVIPHAFAAAPDTLMSSRPTPASTLSDTVPNPLPSDPDSATSAYLATVKPADKARSDAYYEGGYWLQLWDLLYGLVVAWLLLATGLSVKMRDLAGHLFRGTNLRNLVYIVLYMLAAFVLTLPITIYSGFVREHQYHLATQSFGPWFGEQLVSLLISLVAGGIMLTLLYIAFRRLPRTWWLWGSGVAILFMMLFMMIGPVFISPLFNKYQPLEEGPLKASILSLARASGVPATDVYQFDASRQSTRVSANVSGFLGTTRISLNDNLLNRCTPAEIRAVMAHEIGHYALNHIYKMIIPMGLLMLLGFAFVNLAFGAVQQRWGAVRGVQGIGDVAGLPLLMALLSVFFFTLTPVTNTLIRTQEVEADLYGLNAAREPDAFATVSLKLGEYRKLEPSPFEEWLFFDHPSGRSRIFTAMRWKREMMPLSKDTLCPSH